MISRPNEAAIDEIVASCNGDMRGALKALLMVNEHLEAELHSSTRGAVNHGGAVERGRPPCTEAGSARTHGGPQIAPQIGARSDIAAFDLFGQGLDQLRHLFEVRVDGERLAEGVKRALVVAEILHDHAKSGQRAEMARFADQHLLDVFKRMGVVVLQIIQRRAPVPPLDIIRTQLDHGVEQLQRDIHLLGVHRGLGAHHQQRGGIARGLQPQRPDPRFDVLGAGLIRRGLQRAEQKIQSARAIGADFRQLARRFR